MKRILKSALIVMVLASFTACGFIEFVPLEPDTTEQGLVGSWQVLDYRSRTLTFNSDGTGIYSNELKTHTFTWETDGSYVTLNLDYSYTEYAYKYSIEDNNKSLYLTIYLEGSNINHLSAPWLVLFECARIE